MGGPTRLALGIVEQSVASVAAVPQALAALARGLRGWQKG
jgi:hypothetical protein